ncbi:MAG: class I SAM-dependent methyltransferase [Planctomycetes bacterium]|nr:class I SAM-dependent methyltransferase [Planctomycetota bacterium]MCH9724957.1 class I SAM-dependent methyltransferase [Planctomycetota bacterium]MCH9777582.1 class I SAM-dependent methyltransferase [Planctomycetota bacterium]MCH9789283.1 class I SAM-dependent methyltransferase [Planctomycetota bacterium]
MDYLEYFEKFPDSYAKVAVSFDRSRTLNAYLANNGLLENISSILSIGPGEGEVEIKIAKESEIEFGIVEPSKTLFDQLMTNARDADVESKLLEAHQQSFEEFQPARKYDLVLSLFSWFAFGFDQRLLTKALSCRNPNGKLLICLQSESSPSTKISAVSRSSGINLTSETLSTWATSQGFQHEFDIYHGTVPADRFILHGELTQMGKDFASFLTATPWNEIPNEVKSVTLNSLRQAQHEDLIDFQCGCLIFSD